MSNEKEGWTLNVPKDPKQVASYSSSYVRQTPKYSTTREAFESTLKQVSRKTSTPQKAKQPKK